MTRFRLSCIALACFVAFGCARREEPEVEGMAGAAPTQEAGQVPGPASAGAAAAQPADGTAAVAANDAPKIVAGVNVRVTLSPAAASDLSARSETIVVEAVYGGDPVPGSSTATNDFGLVELGNETRELQSSGQVTFDADSIDKTRLPLIAGQPQLMLNVRSGRKSTQANLLACEFYWNSVEAASAATVEIPCKLISE